MLKLFRHKNVTKIVLWGILILILPAFVLWGTGGGGGGKDKGPSFVGLIDNQKVSFNDFAESLTAIRAQIILNYFDQPKVLDTFLGAKAFLGKLAWDRLLMAREAKKANIKISNEDVIKSIRNHPIFSRDGAFDDKMYLYVLRNNMGLDPRRFEEIVRSNLAVQRLNDKLTKDIKVTDEDTLEAYKTDNEKFKISYILFSDDGFIDKADIDEKEVKDYYDEHKDEFIIPAKKDEVNSKAGTIAAFDDVKADIKKFLAARVTRPIAVKYADEEYSKIKDLMAKESLTFEAAATKLGLKPMESAFFAKTEYLEGIGEAGRIVETAVKLNKDAVSSPVEIAKGVMIFRLIDTQKIDDEKFKKEKNDYANKALEVKKTIYLENWLRGIERNNTVNIDFKDYEKYYR